jgi:hypothetical protein
MRQPKSRAAVDGKRWFVYSVGDTVWTTMPMALISGARE